jgi:hypothetical protein
MRNIFGVGSFHFPYTDLKFPGQASDERILYITREAEVQLYIRMMVLFLTGLVLGVTALILPKYLAPVGPGVVELATLFILIIGVLFVVVGGWWVYRLWIKSVFILTNRRLIKFIYTTPWNRYNLSLTLDKVVDTGAYTKGYLQALFRTGTFTARSSAGNRKDKYFYVENVYVVEDLANYVNKLLYAFQHHQTRLDSFRPFIPHLKGDARKKFMERFPGYWS